MAELTPDRAAFYVTFTVDEGVQLSLRQDHHRFQDHANWAMRSCARLVAVKNGDIYSQDRVQKAIESLTNAAGTRGYAFAEVHPRLKRNQDTRTIDLGFEIVQGPRVYIEKINIAGNTRTLDKVIRREFRLQEGDAFNRVLIDRSRTRIRSLGFFKDVEVKNVPGSQPDRTNLTVNVTEQSTGSLSVGLGYSSHTSSWANVSYTEQLVRPRPEPARSAWKPPRSPSRRSSASPSLISWTASWRPASTFTRSRPISSRPPIRAMSPRRCCAWAFRSRNILRGR